MTTTRSIFQKTCPACMVTLALDAKECACGHQFDHDDNDSSLSSEAIRLQAEELYENYLAARAEQASSAVMTAQAEYNRDPGNAQKSQRIAELIQEAEAARAALAAQSGRVAEMRKALPPAPAARPAPATPKQKVAEMKKPQAPAPAARHAHVPTAPKKKIAFAKPAVMPSPARATTRVLKNPDTDDAITTSLVSRRAAKKAAAAPMKRKPAPAPVAAKPEIILPPVQTKAPNPAFRQAQAARAEKILRQAETAAAVKAVIKEETAGTTPATGKKTAAMPPAAAIPKLEVKLPDPPPVPTKSAPRLLGADKKECPNCTASVDNKLNRCRCGFEFPTSESLMPALSMSEEERAEFAKLFRFP
ncbi:MAG: zinc ribbon domain-containing protein [Pseudomonadota bacterium]